MPLWLLSPTTWKLAGAAALLALLGLFYWHYTYLVDQAALVPGLQAQTKSLSEQVKKNDDALAPLTKQIAQNQVDLNKALLDFSQKQTQNQATIQALKEAALHAAASNHPLCAPSAADRKLWNDTITRFLADSQPQSASEPGKVPASP